MGVAFGKRATNGYKTNGPQKEERQTAISNENLSWRDRLNAVADMELWEETKRELRAEWRQFMEEAEAILRKPRRPLPKEIVASILLGDLTQVDEHDLPNVKNKIVVFISSTFTDTKAERNILMKDVFPYLRSLCRILGLEFGFVDMRWGVSKDMIRNHATAAICLSEIGRCVSESAGPAFLAILSHKYGYRPIPTTIERQEYTTLRKVLLEAGKDVSLMDEFYELDENSVPPHHMLKPQPADQTNWWEMNERLQDLLQWAAARCLTGQDLEKYHISITEQEIRHGLLDNERRDSQATVLRRTLADVDNPQHRHRHIIDVVSGEINEEAQHLLRTLKEKKIPDTIDRTAVLDFSYDDPGNVEEDVRKACDAICLALTKNILSNYEQKLHMEKDEVFEEVLQHRELAKDKCRLFVGREQLVSRVLAYVEGDSKVTLAVHGQSGCGKTALMAFCAKTVKETWPEGVCVLRFLGTTGLTGSARNMLHNVCQQISRAYDKDTSAVPTSYKELITHFRQCLGYATSSRPLTLFLDSLDQLSNEDFGRNLKWLLLRKQLPPHCKLVVSTLPCQCLDTLKAFLPEDNFVEIKHLSAADGSPILDKILSAKGRTLTEGQRKIVLDAFQKCPLPLYLSLAADVALRWRSHDTIDPDDLPTSVSGLITNLFERLENRYGKRLVHHALAYITVAKNGLSVTELEDILSCDDVVLNDVFSFWTPPHIRIPPLLWIRIRNELGMYLVERGTGDGMTTYAWYHRQFWETAERRFIDRSPESPSTTFENSARRALADYFEGRWYDGKQFHDKNGQTSIRNRHIANQPLVLAGSRSTGRMLNKRKLAELSHQLLRLGDWAKFKQLVVNLEFIEGKFAAQQGYECVSEFLEASKRSFDRDIAAVSRFIGANLSHLLREPDAIYQLASQQVVGGTVRSLFERFPIRELPRRVIIDRDPNTVEDPCQMTLRGHASGIRSCVYSPTGELLASCGEDGSLRVWDAFSGAEIVTVTDLPGPTYPGLADPYHGERPCSFSRDGKHVVTGSEDSWIQVWDLTGAQVHSTKGHSAAITGIAHSPDNSTMATTSKDKTTKFWTVSKDTIKLTATVNIEMPGLECDYSSDGQYLAVSCSGGLVIIETSSHTIFTANAGFCSYNFGACFSPNGEEVSTGGDDSCVTLWDAHSGKPKNKLVGHRGWVWATQYTKDGSKLLSCSSDRTIKVWDMISRLCLATVGGHLHRVSCVSIHPDQVNFVTGSLDSSLKIWDYEAIISGNTSQVNNLHYNVLKVSADQKYVITSQGWSRNCVISSREGQTIAQSGEHVGSLYEICISPDCQMFVSVDTGHGGQYTENAVYNAEVMVSTLPEADLLAKLAVRGPCALSCRNDVIVVGTADGKIHVFDRNTYSEISSWSFSETGTAITNMSCQPVSGHVAVASGEIIKIWNISNSGDETLVKEIPKNGQTIPRCLYSPDGVYLVTTDLAGDTNVWIADDGYRLFTKLSGHTCMLRDLAFSPSGRFLATVGVEMSLRIWDVSGCFRMVCAWYGPVNQLGFLAENELILGEATGNKRFVYFEEDV